MINTPIAGYFKLEAVSIQNGKETRRLLADWFPNLITDMGMDMMGTTTNIADDILERCRVGSGNTAPSFSDSGLVNEIARSNSIITTTTGIAAGPPRYGWKRRVYRFNEGVAAGNISELGVGRDNTGLFSRALVVDVNGNPTTITVLSNEFLDVTYELRLYIPTGDTAFQALIGTTSYNVVMRVAENDDVNYWAEHIPFAYTGSNNNWWSAALFTGGLAAENLSPSGPISASPNTLAVMARDTYVTGTYYVSRSMYIPIEYGNANIKTIVIRSAIGQYQFEFTPAIPKTNEKTLNMTFRIHWARHTP